MKRFTLSLVALLAVCCLATSTVQAAAFGSAILKITDAKLEKFVGGVWINATAADINVVSTTVVSETNASLMPALSTTSGVTGGFDALQSFVSPTLVAPGQNSFVSNGNPLADSYARADTNGSGASLIAAGGVSTSSIAEVSSVNALGGASDGGVVGNGIFKIQVAKSGLYRISFMGDVHLETTGDGVNFGTAQSDYRIQLNGGSLAFVNNSDTNLNKTISGAGGLYNFAGLILSNGVQLNANSTNTFSIKQLTTASVTTPEPTSIAIVGLLGVGALFAGRRNRKS